MLAFTPPSDTGFEITPLTPIGSSQQSPSPLGLRAELAERYGAQAPPHDDAPFELPPLLRESIVCAAQLDDGQSLDDLIGFYTERMPQLLREQLVATSPAARLLYRGLRLERLPRLRQALEGLFRVLEDAGLPLTPCLGAETPAELLSQRPSPMAIYRSTLFGQGLPMLGAYPAELATMDADLEAGRSAEEVVDLRLSGNLIHELCHGRSREHVGAAPSWMVFEAAAIHLGAAAFPRHAFPEQAGEAVPAAAPFVMLGDTLAARFGTEKLWSVLFGLSVMEEAFDPPTAAALRVAEWQSWLLRPRPPFAPDACRVLDWVKLVEACRTPSPLAPLLEQLQRAQNRSFTAAVGELPSLLEACRELPWSCLPIWTQPMAADTLQRTHRAIRALFQVNLQRPNFQTHPAELPEGYLQLQVESACILAKPRPQGVYGEPARWLLPVPMVAQLARRGAERIHIHGVRREDASSVAEALVELASASDPLKQDEELRWTSSPRS